ncbi:low molecular weight protein-tyrosine-phosphatase [Paraburkholderia sp. IMGN_8]|uniref:low molecular weight protein-tyrosine-phosphatase n=1 Tax=Paraburkholderia sp. IMGN_8 TaxID=3136564 RepID=UPI003100BA64
MISSLLVVCHANICRSPMAEVLLRKYLPQVTVASAGIQALVGYPAASHAFEVAAAQGFDLASHRARNLDAAQCTRADLILVMEDVQRRYVETRYPFTRGRVFCLGITNGRPADIPDPYGGQRSAFEQCMTRLEHSVTAWRERINSLHADS